MNPLFVLAWMSGGLAVLLCLTFVAFAVVKMTQLLRVHGTVRQLQTEVTRAAEQPAASMLAADKVIEASAKLTDSLAKAPMPVVAVVTAIIFMALAILSAYLGRPPVPATVVATSAAAMVQPAGAAARADKPARDTQ
jgi:hypothetical protein